MKDALTVYGEILYWCVLVKPQRFIAVDMIILGALARAIDVVAVSAESLASPLVFVEVQQVHVSLSVLRFLGPIRTMMV